MPAYAQLNELNENLPTLSPLPSESLETSSEQPEIDNPPEDLPSTELFPQNLLADPNPLSRPTLVEEVEIEQIQVITLEEAIELAYANNQDLQAALLELEQSQAILDEAEAALLPTVDTTADTTFREDQGTIFEDGSGIDTSLGSTVEINYDLFTSGTRRATIRAAEAQVRLDTLEVERTQEELRLNTA
ncbi:MAG: TolC family protein, partial [Cyanobacteria bacterium P01_D01_bin.156]